MRQQKGHTPAASWLLTAVACAITAALCQAFLLPPLPPPSAAPCNGGSGSSWSSRRGRAPSTPPADGLDGSSRRRQRQGALPHILLAAATESSEWGRLGEANAPLLLALRRAAMKGDAPAAEAAVAALEGDGARADLIALTHLMQAYAVRRDVDGARAVLTRMEAEGLKPDLVPFSILLNLHADLADVDAAEATFGEFARRKLPCSTREFTSLMKAYMRARDPDGAEDVLFRMAASGQAPDIHAYTVLLRAYAKLGDVRGAEDVMRRVFLAAEVPFTSSIPSSTGSSSSIGSSSSYPGGMAGESGSNSTTPRSGRGGMGGFYPDVVLFNALLRIHVKKGIRLRRTSKSSTSAASSEAGINSVLQRMEQWGVPPDETTRALLASFRGERVVPPVVSRLSSAAAVLGRGEQQRGLSASSSLATTPSPPPPAAAAAAAAAAAVVVAAAVPLPTRRAPPKSVEGQEEETGAAAAAEVQMQQEEEAMRRRVKGMEAALAAKLRGGAGEEVEEEEVLEVLRACVEAGDDVTARRVLASLPPTLATLPTHNLLLHLHARKGDAGGGERVLGQILQRGLQPSLTTYNTLLQAYVRRATRGKRLAKEEYKRVLQVYTALRAAKDPTLWPDSYTLTAVLRCLQIRAGSNRAEREEAVIQEPYTSALRDVAVLLDSQRRSSQLYTALLGAAAAMRDWPTVEQTYREAKQQLAAGFMPARAFRFVEGAYARVQAANNRGGDLQRPDVPKEDVASVGT